MKRHYDDIFNRALYPTCGLGIVIGLLWWAIR